MDDTHGASEVSDADRPRPSRAGGPGLIIAALLVMLIVFGAGLGVGAGLAGSGAPQPTASPVAIASPSAAPTASAPQPTATAQPTATQQPATPAASAAPTEVPTATPASTEPPVARPTLPPDAPDGIGLLWEALRFVREHYVDRAALEDENLTYGAIRGMVEALGDTGHSVFLTPEDLAAERDALEGRLTGIGAFLGERAGRPVIVSVISGGPAARAGIRSGDIIEAVDGRSTDRLRPEQVADRVRGEAGTPVTLTVVHAGTTESVDVTIVRERFEIPPVTWTIVPGTSVADIRLIQFSSGAAAAVTEALREALEDGAHAVILDLRSNPGGLVDEAVGVASQFIDHGVVYQRQDATGSTAPVEVRPDGVAVDVPLVVLVDQGTASSAEIVSGAIQGNERGPVIGVRTFGTGTVLNTFELSDGSAVRVGVERWLTPEGDLIFDKGITPDEVIELSAEAVPLEPPELETLTPEEIAGSSDAQLLRALEILAETSGRD